VTEWPKSSHEPARNKEPVVFVIDDDASMRSALTNLFQSVGLQAEAFGAATEMLQRKLPDVASCLVLDIRLPGLSGLDFQNELAKANIHIPIIFMTGHKKWVRGRWPISSEWPRRWVSVVRSRPAHKPIYKPMYILQSRLVVPSLGWVGCSSASALFQARKDGLVKVFDNFRH
jgi:response regulator receiver domain-containing protein